MSDETTAGSSTHVPVTIDADVWIPVQDASNDATTPCYARGRVTAIGEDNANVVVVETESGTTRTVRSGDVFLRDAVTQEDMVKLNHLHEAGVLDNLERRYSKNTSSLRFVVLLM